MYELHLGSHAVTSVPLLPDWMLAWSCLIPGPPSRRVHPGTASEDWTRSQNPSWKSQRWYNSPAERQRDRETDRQTDRERESSLLVL